MSERDAIPDWARRMRDRLKLAMETEVQALDRDLVRKLALAEATGMRVAAIPSEAAFLLGIPAERAIVILGPGESAPTAPGYIWTIYELVAGEWRGRKA